MANKANMFHSREHIATSSFIHIIYLNCVCGYLIILSPLSFALCFSTISAIPDKLLLSPAAVDIN